MSHWGSITRTRSMDTSFSLVLTVLDAMGYGGLLVSGDGAIASKNGSADRILERMFKSFAKSDRPAGLPQNFLTALEMNAPGPTFLTVGRVRPIVAHRFPIAADIGPAFLLLIADLNALKGPQAEVLQRGFGLTPCEARLATALSTGMNLNEVAKLHRVEIGTVRGQLKSVFVKTATKRQAELIAVLARLTGFDRGLPIRQNGEFSAQS